MYGKKFMKRLIAVTMAMSVFFVGKNILASQTHDTDVTLTIDDMVYTLTIPSNTSLPTDGTTIALTNGLTVSDGKLGLGRRLDITISSKNNWKLKDETATINNQISYALYANETDVNSNTLWSFTRDEANTANSGTTKQIYAAAQINEVYLADAGTYKDIITFTASVESSYYPLQSNDRLVFLNLNIEDCTTWYDTTLKPENTAQGLYYHDGYSQMSVTHNGKTYYAWDPATDNILNTDSPIDPSAGIYLRQQ